MAHKVGLFGDSFTGIDKQPSMKYHWITLVAKELGWTVNNYGEAGSSIYYSYKKFQKHHQENHLNIFLITDPHRYMKKIDVAGLRGHVPSLFSLEHRKNEMDKEVYRDMQGWFMCSDYEHNLDMVELMLEKIQSMDNDVIFLGSCFDENHSRHIVDKFKLPKYSLHKVQLYMFRLLGIRDSEIHSYIIRESNDLISGHLIPEMNEVVANVVLERIKTGIWNWNLPKSIDFKFDKKDYWNI